MVIEILSVTRRNRTPNLLSTCPFIFQTNPDKENLILSPCIKTLNEYNISQNPSMLPTIRENPEEIYGIM